MPETGTIKWFNTSKGYGFIIPDAGGVDVMFFGDAVLNRRATPEAGMKVAYRLYSHETKGLRAADVQLHVPDGPCPLCGGRRQG